jgi:predicted alpha/beta hydrolase family esterase
MPRRRPTRALPTVILPGWRGSGPPAWQEWLAGQLREAGREVRDPQLPEPERPDVAAWLATLRATLAGLPDTGFDVVAHSLGAVLWLHHVAEPDGSPRPARVALVAPPSPAAGISEIAAFFPVPLDVDVVRHGAEGTVLVGGDDDPYCPEGVAAAYGQPLKMATTVLPGAGHLTGEAGYREWPAMLSWCNRDNLAFY